MDNESFWYGTHIAFRPSDYGPAGTPINMNQVPFSQSYKSIKEAVSHKVISQYTKIDSLLKILKSRTFLFNRIDKVNDIEEADRLHINHLSERVFISCFDHSDLKNESIPLWHIYTPKGWGARISLHIRENQRIDELFVKDCVFNTNIPAKKCSWNRDNKDLIGYIRAYKCQDVMYLTDSERDEQLLIGKNESEIDFNMGVIAAYKNVGWKYENETRFVTVLSPTGDGVDERFFDVSYFLLPIDFDVLEHITITFDPWMSEEIKECLKHEILSYSLDSKIYFEDSVYTNKIFRQ